MKEYKDCFVGIPLPEKFQVTKLVIFGVDPGIEPKIHQELFTIPVLG